MKMFYTEHVFKLILKFYEFSLKFHAERIQQKYHANIHVLTFRYRSVASQELTEGGTRG